MVDVLSSELLNMFIVTIWCLMYVLPLRFCLPGGKIIKEQTSQPPVNLRGLLRGRFKISGSYSLSQTLLEQ